MPLAAIAGFSSTRHASRNTGTFVTARLLKPGVLVRCLVDDEIDQHTNSALPRTVTMQGLSWIAICHHASILPGVLSNPGLMASMV
jgi:hypothetical protein